MSVLQISGLHIGSPSFMAGTTIRPTPKECDVRRIDPYALSDIKIPTLIITVENLRRELHNGHIVRTLSILQPITGR